MVRSRGRCVGTLTSKISKETSPLGSAGAAYWGWRGGLNQSGAGALRGSEAPYWLHLSKVRFARQPTCERILPTGRLGWLKEVARFNKVAELQQVAAPGSARRHLDIKDLNQRLIRWNAQFRSPGS